MRFVTGVLTCVLVLTSAGVVMAETEKDKPYVEPLAPTAYQLLDCSNAIPINCGDVVTGDNTGMPNNVDFYSCIGWTESGGEVVYTLDLPGPFNYNVTADLQANGCDLDWFLLGSCDENDCICYAGISGTCSDLEPGTYYLVVDGYNGAECAYTLSVECEELLPPCCPFPYVCFEVDFNETDGGYYTLPCDGAPVWEWGPPLDIPTVACDNVPVTNVLGTILGGDYLASSGEIAVIGPFSIDDCCWCMELCHYYDTEASFDGGNVKISTDGGMTWQLITPARGYDDDATSSSCRCIPLEPAFTGHQFNDRFLRDCFDLTEYMGQTVLIGFFFGSDGSVQYPGWYPKWVKFGSEQPSSTDGTSWGAIKSLYR